MTTTKDVRDMLGVTADQVVPRPKPSKKKPKTTLPRPDGITRELYALMGERAPPIPIATKPKFKAKLARNTVPSKWRWTPFLNEARDDHLYLSHWRKEDLVNAKQPQSQQQQPSDPTPQAQTQQTESNGEQPIQAPAEPTPNDSEPSQLLPSQDGSAQTSSNANGGTLPPKQYPFAKFNVQVPKLEYSESEYETHLKTESWSKEETDYLVDLVAAYSQKWPVIHDRYDYKPPQPQQPEASESSELVAMGKERPLEELKMRYYAVSAKVLELRTPLENMTADELNNHEKMLKFNPAQEITRKRLKEALLHRSIDEKREEEYLLAELRRIWTHQQRFSTELRDLRQRLDHSLTDEPADFQPLTNSQAINNVFQKVFQNRDKGKMQRRSLTGEPNNMSPATGGPHALNTAAAQAAGSGSATNTPTTAGNKKGANTANSALNQNHRLVSPRHEPRFGITTHERLTGGITFRSDKLTKARQAKSLTQTQKIAAVLAELGVPDLLQMPTVPVCEAMESLVSKVNLLIDARRVREKEENELKVANQQLQTKTGVPNSDEQTKEGDNGETTKENEEGQKQEQQENQGSEEKPKTEDGGHEDADVSMTDAPAEEATDQPKDDDEAVRNDESQGAKAKNDEDVEDETLMDEEDEDQGEEEAIAEDEDETTLNQDRDADGSEGDDDAELEENDVDEGNGSNQDDDEEPSEQVDVEVDGDDEDGPDNEAHLDIADEDHEAEVEAEDLEEDFEEEAENEEAEDNEEEVEDGDNDEEPPSSPPGVSSPAPSVGRPATRNGSTSAAQTPTASATLGVNTRTRGKRSASVLSAASSASNAGPSAGVRRGDRKRARR